MRLLWPVAETHVSGSTHAAKEALHLHLNAAMTALNFIKLEDSQQAPDSEPV